jgi:hypothetical protein
LKLIEIYIFIILTDLHRNYAKQIKMETKYSPKREIEIKMENTFDERDDHKKLSSAHFPIRRLPYENVMLL